MAEAGLSGDLHAAAATAPTRTTPWPALLRLSLAQMTGWGLLYYAFSVVQVPMAQDLGWSTTLVSGGFSLALLVAALAGMVFGPRFDRSGPWLIMILGGSGGMAILAAWSLVAHPIVYLVLMAALGLAMAACLYEPAFYLVARWFPLRRAPAFTVLTCFGALASPIFLPLTERLCHAWTWRGGLLACAAIGAVVVVPLLISLPRAHHPGNASTADRRILARAAFAEARFRWLLLGYIAVAIPAIALPVHLVPALVAQGESLAFAAVATGAIALVGLVGRLAFAAVGDGRALVPATVLVFTAMTVAVALLLALPGRIGTIAFVACFGLGYGALWPTRAALVTRAWGGPALATISARFALGPNLAKAAAPLLAALIIDWWGDRWAFALLGSLPALGAACILRAEPDADV